MKPLSFYKIPRDSIKSKYIEFKGGLDQVTPPISANPGALRNSQNFEIDIISGYRRIQGYEAFDGRPKPSNASYSRIDVNITGTVSVGDIVTGDLSAATGVVIAVVTTASPNYIIITKRVSNFTAGEDLLISAVIEANAIDSEVIDGAATVKLHAQYRNLAADEYRADITAVPGSGNVLGVQRLGSSLYAFRNDAGGTETLLYKDSAAGWTQVALGYEVSFSSGGVYEIMEGDTITGQVSTSTAVITRVMLQSGSWAEGTAQGKLIYASQSGPFQAEDLDVGANVDVATIVADGNPITLLPNGRFEFIINNFGGLAGARKMYGCDSVNRAFEFDGTVFAPINTGMVADTPEHIAAFKNHLFLSFSGSVQHSGIGTPFAFTVILGAAELAVGDVVTGFMKQPGSEGNASLAIFARNRIHILYGNSSLDWNLVFFREEVGAYAHTVQEFGMTLFLDDRGITNLLTVQAFGNFRHNSLSRHIRPFINDKKNEVTASCLVRDKNQYRLFFSDGSALYVTTDNTDVLGMMPILFTNPVECITSDENPDGTEEIYFGSDNGFVYELEKGTSFDGEPIPHFLTFHYNHFGSPRMDKNFKSLTLEAEGNGYAEFDLTYELGYGSVLISQPGTTTNILELQSAQWDQAVWDAFFWDGKTLSPNNADLVGTAENISLTIRGESDYFAAMRFSGALTRYAPRRQLRQ
jgi:hypothetical protein